MYLYITRNNIEYNKIIYFNANGKYILTFSLVIYYILYDPHMKIWYVLLKNKYNSSIHVIDISILTPYTATLEFFFFTIVTYILFSITLCKEVKIKLSTAVEDVNRLSTFFDSIYEPVKNRKCITNFRRNFFSRTYRYSLRIIYIFKLFKVSLDWIWVKNVHHMCCL